MKVVRFTRGYRAYNAGETAGFLPEVADELIAAGIATDLDAADQAAADQAAADQAAADKAAADKAAADQAAAAAKKDA